MRTLLHFAALLCILRSAAQPTYYWPLDESDGIIAHDAIGGNNGSLQGACTWQPSGGQHAGALRLYGNDAQVQLGPSDVVTGTGDQLTIACWFKPLIVNGTERVLVAKTIGTGPDDWIWSLSLVNNTGARFRVKCATGVAVADIPPSSIFSNTWYHLAATYDGSGLRLFLNGSTAGSGAAHGVIGYHPEAPATLGNILDNSLPFYGELDDVRIYDHALTGFEVVDLVIGDISTGVHETISTRSDGHVQLPAGNWQRMSVQDAAGRTVKDLTLTSTAPPALPDLPAGPYAITLRSSDRVLSRTVVVP